MRLRQEQPSVRAPTGGRLGCADPQRGHVPIRTLDPCKHPCGGLARGEDTPPDDRPRWLPPGAPQRPARDRGLAPGRPGRPAAVPVLPDRPAVRPRGRGAAAGRHGRLRDLGRAGPRRGQRRARVPRPHRRQPRRRRARRRATRPPAGGRRRSARAGRSTPTAGSSSASTCSAAARARPGPRLTPPRRRPPVGVPVPGRVDAGHGPHPGRGGRPPRHRPVGAGGRRVDGRHAGPRVGRHVPRAGPGPGPDRHRRGRQRRPDRLVEQRAPGHPHGPPVAGRRLLRRRRRATAPTRAWPPPG